MTDDIETILKAHGVKDAKTELARGPRSVPAVQAIIEDIQAANDAAEAEQ